MALVDTAPQSATVVDLGCGPGTVLRLVRQRRSDLQLKGADIDPDMVAQARSKDTSGTIEFHGASIDALPFDDQCADIVVSSLAFHHLPTETKSVAFKEIRRILKPNGIFFLCDFSLPHHPVFTPMIYFYVKFHATTGAQIRGELLELAAKDHAVVKTLWQLYGCISLHRITFQKE